MRLLGSILLMVLQTLLISNTNARPHLFAPRAEKPIAPKVMIIAMASHSYPVLAPVADLTCCTADGYVCLQVTGEGEVNSAASLMALVLSPQFDLSKTYFLLAGIAGVNPKYGTLGSVALAQYSVQVALQYEIDSRSLPSNWPTGYISYGRDQPHEYPFIAYGTEVFELNAKLRDTAFDLASEAELSDDNGPREYRALYGRMGESYTTAARPPAIVKCDTATSDVYYSGSRLSEAFENTTKVWTNGTGLYCMTAQEDNAMLEVLVRAAIEKLVDFERVMVLRTGSNFDRPPPDCTDLEHLTNAKQNGFSIAIDNIFNAGVEIVKGIIKDWDCKFKAGIKAENYVGDIFGSLGGEPDFGFGSITRGERVAPDGNDMGLATREMDRRKVLTQKSLRKI
ncbi:hypothetical protein FDECE_528 [Fusarium decemcellulare]|nr:hypothetical protein FDECE_528 [Fusarium decemcellulare]